MARAPGRREGAGHQGALGLEGGVAVQPSAVSAVMPVAPVSAQLLMGAINREPMVPTNPERNHGPFPPSRFRRRLLSMQSVSLARRVLRDSPGLDPCLAARWSAR
jgi:hypothetical protein